MGVARTALLVRATAAIIVWEKCIMRMIAGTAGSGSRDIAVRLNLVIKGRQKNLNLYCSTDVVWLV